MLARKSKLFFSIAITAIMSLGGVTAWAAGGTSLGEAPKINLENIEYKKGNATVVEGAIPKVIYGQTEVGTLLSVAEGINLKDIKIEEGTFTIIEGSTLNGYEGRITLGSSLAEVGGIKLESGILKKGSIEKAEGVIQLEIDSQKTDSLTFNTTAGK
jgi:hypothetical protein